MLRTAGETETTRQNIQDCLKLHEGDPGFQRLTEAETAADIVISTACIIKLSIYSFSKFFIVF
jgi:hypothetical protein